jgi:hypothetical protein
MRVLGPDHPDTLTTTYNLASALSTCRNDPMLRKVERAEGLFRTLLDAQRRVYGDAHPRTSSIIESLLEIARFRKSARSLNPTGI